MPGNLQEQSQISGALSPVESMSGGLSAASDLSGNLTLPTMQPYELQPATTSTLGGVIVGDHLSVTGEGLLSVVVANDAEHDNTNPISAAAVYTEIGDINALLATI